MLANPPSAFPPKILVKEFEATFGGSPDFLVRSPGRVDLIGAHTDYNDGWVLPAAITRTAWLAVRACSTPQVTVRTLEMDGRITFRLDEISLRRDLTGRALPDWACYPAGVAWSLQQAGLAVPGSQIVLSSDVPIGAGLSSSAAVEVAYGLAWAHIANWPVDKMALAQYCQRAENQYVGVNSGLMDQFACLFGQAGHALLFDCRTLEWEAVPLPGDVALIIADTGTRRTLSNSHYNERRADCEEALRALQPVLPEIKALRDVSPAQFGAYQHVIPERARRRAAHIIAENGRVRAAAGALGQGDAALLGRLMDESHASARDLFEASGPQLEAMWEAAHGHPACLGGRFVGAGWAGCMVFLVRAEGSDDFMAYLSRRYEARTGVASTLYQMQAADGVQIVAPDR